ncbi:MAG: class I SAM-dependent methyltransferase [Bdellovibrionales bacterium]|nr:class I SAM-dependent methyltransferase [Bdellovibrionales bacterium]
METKSQGYLHGYTAEEQNRLYQQANFLETSVFESIDFSKSKRLLEVACGVGAQTEILLKRFPQIKIDGIDASQEQIRTAKNHLKSSIDNGQVTLTLGNAGQLPYQDHAFDSSFVCWFLEHVDRPIEILKEIRRVLEPRGIIYCTEVLNATFFLHPYSPATLQYWFHFNDHQWNLGGDPFVGAKLGNYLTEAGFTEVTTEAKIHHFDNRHPKMRKQMLDYWTQLLLSGTAQLLESQKVSEELVMQMREELELLKLAADSVFFYSAIQARALA